MPTPVLHIERLRKSGFSLDSSGIAGFFGGEEAFAAMISIHLMPSRRWLGWYNSPGSYFVAKKYGILPNSTFWDGLFPGPPTTPAELLEMDSKRGPRYTGVLSGTQLPTTGHLAYLLFRYCLAQKVTASQELSQEEKRPSVIKYQEEKESLNTTAKEEPKIRHREIYVTIVNFEDIPPDRPTTSYIPPEYFKPLSLRGKCIILATTFVTLAATVLSALSFDFFSFSMILFGAFVNGITSLVLGNGKLCLDLTNPSKKSPPGDGFFFERQNIVIVQGNERVISTLLHQGFRLAYDTDKNYHKIGICSILLLAQFLLQLVLIPQGILIGQLLFVLSLAASWICNGYLASFDREDLQTNLLFKLLGVEGGPKPHKFKVDKWATAVAFCMFYLSFHEGSPEGIINELMPNNTPAWNLWKECICAAARYNEKPGTFVREKTSETGSNGAEEGPGLQGEAAQLAADLTKRFGLLSSQNDKTFVREFLQEADRQFDKAKNTREKLEKEKSKSPKTKPVPLVGRSNGVDGLV